MLTDRHLALILFCITILAAPLHAQVAPPNGWTSQNVGNVIALRSPGPDQSPRLGIVLLPTGHPIGNTKSWFDKQTMELAKATGPVVGVAEVTEPQPGILVRVIQVETKNHEKAREVFYGYAVQHGFGITILSIPASFSDQDPQLETANQYIQNLAAQKFELAATPATQQAPGTTRSSSGQYVGQFGKSDIDLSYHAKAIIPKDRDVPLKGVYLFVGYAYGASYGGVGTTMTWGQKFTQQLLLLFENGVAAKTDLRGGNLAGKYQAEGFATMDVANPAAVSGSPFGHWTDNGDSIQIQWNIGAPTLLAKDGDNLQGKGEKWTPFHLPEGDLIEGTFVRKMEAGLRSQAIVLRKDGTFVGDGVNVTMGGSIVNPAFPERGAGTYEVHKGSMILSFSNGFTQSIACILDMAGDGAIRTVVLNGFPFERVR